MTTNVTPAALVASPKPLLWSFIYDGPIAPIDDRSCDMCNAASAKKCPKDAMRHGPNISACSSCYAARVGYCHNHGGLDRALTEHFSEHGDIKHHETDAAHEQTYHVAKDAILAYVAILSKDAKLVHVQASAVQDQPDAPYADLRIAVTVRK